MTIEFQPPNGLALWIPLPAESGKAYLKTGCEHSVRVGLFALTVPEGFTCDAASIPRILRWMIPEHHELAIHRAGIFHDYAYRVQPCSRWQADALFRDILSSDKVPRWLSVICWLSVRAFGWQFWGKNSSDRQLYENRMTLDFDPQCEGWHEDTNASGSAHSDSESGD